MNSCLYECSVMHHRFEPKVHHFENRIFMFYLDLDEVNVIPNKIRWFSRNRRNIYSFRDSDHEPAGNEPIKTRILGYLRQNQIDLGEGGRVMLLTLPRVLGYIFNPISIYFCFNREGKPVCSVAEVGNTFREMKLYLLREENFTNSNSFNRILPKHFYVSPFSSLHLKFDFRLRVPGEELNIKIDDCDGDRKIVISTLLGKRAEFSNRNLRWFTFKYPLITLKVIFLIHWQAFRLWLKGVPFYRKAENVALQQEVLRPHSTILSGNK